MVHADAREQDLRLAEQISEEARSNPNSPFAHKFVGILAGKVVVVADTAEDGLTKLRELDPDPGNGLLIAASADHESVYEIWAR